MSTGRLTRPVRLVDAALRAASAAGAYVAAAGITLIMLGTCADVARRALTDRSVPGVIEGSEVLLVIAAFLGLGFTQRAGAHVATSVLTDRLPARLSAAVRAAGLVVAVLFLLWVVDATGTLAAESVRTGEYRFGLVQVPIWPGRIAVAVGFALLAAELLRELVLVLRELVRR